MALRSGPLPEVCGDGPTSAAELVESSVMALTTGLRRLLEDRQRRDDLIARGRQRAALFSWDRCADETWAVYEHVLRC